MAKLKDTEIDGNLHVSGDIQIGDTDVMTAIDELNTKIETVNTKIPFNLDWVFINGDFMQVIEHYCKSGKHYFVIFQTAGSMTNGGEVPIYGLGTLITNGNDRHQITAHSGGSGTKYHVAGFNNLNTYASTGWVWYNL